MTEENVLPPFPVDEETLSLLSTALDPGPEAKRTSVNEFLQLMSEMGGSDTDAVTETTKGEFLGEEIDINVMRDPQYHEHDVLRAMIAEVRRLRDPENATPREYHAERAQERLVEENDALRKKIADGIMELIPDEIGRISKGLALAIALGELDDEDD